MNRENVQTAWCEPSDRAQESLRRFVFSNDAKCTGGRHSYHDAESTIGEVALALDRNSSGDDDFDHADPRWPQTCGCGYVFQPEDQWQHLISRKWRRGDTGQLYTLHDLPPGSMYDGDWMGEHRRGPDGIHLVVIGPAKCGAWDVDGPSRSGGSGWTRTGDPRQPATLSVTPSIYWNQGGGDDSEWHGFLVGGVLKSC